MNKGYLYTIISMACWGLVYVLPLFVPEFNAMELAMGRHLVYGAISLLLLLTVQKELFTKKYYSLKYISMGILFSLTGFILFFMFFVTSIRYLGGTIATISLSLIPISVSIYGNFRNKEFPISQLLPPIFLIILGIVFMHTKDIIAEHGIINCSNTIIGMSCSLGAIVSWTWYGVNNGRFLNDNPDIDPICWASFTGVISFILTFTMWIYYSIKHPENLHFYSSTLTAREVMTFIFYSLALGTFGTWMGTVFFNKATKHLPMSILGQLLVLEILFGLLYIYLKEMTPPSYMELLGIGSILIGLIDSFRRVRQSKKLKNICKT